MVRRSLHDSAFLCIRGRVLLRNGVIPEVQEEDVRDCVFEPHHVQLLFILPTIKLTETYASVGLFGVVSTFASC
jgi:hypothetical protein